MPPSSASLVTKINNESERNNGRQDARLIYHQHQWQWQQRRRHELIDNQHVSCLDDNGSTTTSRNECQPASKMSNTSGTLRGLVTSCSASTSTSTKNDGNHQASTRLTGMGECQLLRQLLQQQQQIQHQKQQQQRQLRNKPPYRHQAPSVSRSALIAFCLVVCCSCFTLSKASVFHQPAAAPTTPREDTYQNVADDINGPQLVGSTNSYDEPAGFTPVATPDYSTVRLDDERVISSSSSSSGLAVDGEAGRQSDQEAERRGDKQVDGSAAIRALPPPPPALITFQEFCLRYPNECNPDKLNNWTKCAHVMLEKHQATCMPISLGAQQAGEEIELAQQRQPLETGGKTNGGPEVDAVISRAKRQLRPVNPDGYGGPQATETDNDNDHDNDNDDDTGLGNGFPYGGQASYRNDTTQAAALAGDYDRSISTLAASDAMYFESLIKSLLSNRDSLVDWIGASSPGARSAPIGVDGPASSIVDNNNNNDNNENVIDNGGGYSAGSPLAARPPVPAAQQLFGSASGAPMALAPPVRRRLQPPPPPPWTGGHELSTRAWRQGDHQPPAGRPRRPALQRAASTFRVSAEEARRFLEAQHRRDPPPMAAGGLGLVLPGGRPALSAVAGAAPSLSSSSSGTSVRLHRSESASGDGLIVDANKYPRSMQQRQQQQSLVDEDGQPRRTANKKQQQQPEQQESTECQLRKFKFEASKSDEFGNRCSGFITASICYGACDTGEIADWLFPYKKSIHKVCRHGRRLRRRATLRDCIITGDQVAAGLRDYYYVDAADCVCKKCTSVDTTCLGTMSAPHLDTLSEAEASLLEADELGAPLD